PLVQAPNVTTFGSLRQAESASYDAERDLYVLINRGLLDTEVPDDGYVSLLNPDGTVHTLKWIGVTRDGLVLKDPRGSHIVGGRLYVADIDHVRWVDMATGAPQGSIEVPGAVLLNDLQVTAEGTIYATDTGSNDEATWRVYRITPQGEVTVLVQGSPLNRPNGIHLDADGNIVVVNTGDDRVLTFSSSGELLETEQASDPGSDGIVIAADGTKYVSSVTRGTVSRIRPGQPSERIASGIPSAASLTLDTRRNRLIIPQNQQNAVTFIDLDR